MNKHWFQFFIKEFAHGRLTHSKVNAVAFITVSNDFAYIPPR